MRKPMTVDYTRTSYHQHHMKPVLTERTLDTMGSLADWELLSSPQGYGCVEPAVREGRPVLRLQSDVVSNRPNTGEPGRGWGRVTLKRSFPGEDWRAYNRIALDVYPDLPGFRVVSLCLYLYNEGEVKLPNDNEHEGLHFVVLRNHAWNHVYWEVPDLSRDHVTGIGLQYRLQGAEPGADPVVTYDFASLRLQKVEADHTRGWQPKAGEITFSHTGYTPGTQKTAIASGLSAQTFDVVRCGDNAVRFTGPVQAVKAHTGAYQVLDFSGLREEGRFFLRAGATETRPFAIGRDVWRSTLEKDLDFFFAERCGFPVPGVHDICHADLRGRHGEQTKVMNGGWHDAGDLSQGLVNTAEAAYAMMTLARSLGAGDSLRDALSEEARWGQDWVLKTRFSDGYRVVWLTMDYWSDGVMGTADDVTFDASRMACDNFVAVASEALAARFWREQDPPFALRNLKAAREDFAWAHEDRDSRPGASRIDVYSQGALAALELYDATGEQDYLTKAAEYGAVVLACQQTEPMAWAVPLSGFFYTDEGHGTIRHFAHRGHEQTPLLVLRRLLTALPGHGDAARWRRALALYGGYIKAVTAFTAPYFMLPAGVYGTGEDDLYGRGGCEDAQAVRQIQNGIRMDDDHFLRLFPVWDCYRGNSGTTLSQACAAAECALALKDTELIEICRRALEWHVGRNPFNQSLIWGEGYNYSTRYTAMSGDLVGSFPVGIQTQFDEDVPYFPDSNCYTYKEVWVHPASRWMLLQARLREADF